MFLVFFAVLFFVADYAVALSLSFLLSLLYRPRLELVSIIDLALDRVSAIGVVIAGLIVLESLESVRELVDVDVSTVSNISDASLRRPAIFFNFSSSIV